MVKKISELNEPTYKLDDLNKLFTLGYKIGEDGLNTNVKINQSSLRDAILSNISNAIYSSSSDGSNKVTLKNKIDALSDELSQLSATTGSFITNDDLQEKLSSIFTDENINDEDIISFINDNIAESTKEYASSVDIFNTIIKKIKELHENQIENDDDEPSNPPLTDTTEIENKIIKLENVLGLNADIKCPNIEFDIPSNFSDTEKSYIDAAKNYNDTLGKYIVISSDDYSKKGIVDSSVTDKKITDINKSIPNISTHFVINPISVTLTGKYIDYSNISNLIINCRDTINSINNICDIIPLFYYEEGSSQDSQDANNYVKKLSDIKGELNTIDVNGFIENDYPSIILSLLDNITESYTEIESNLNVNDNWSGIISVNDELDNLIAELRTLLNLENEDAIDFDLIKSKISNFYSALETNFKNLSTTINSETITLKQLPEETKIDRDNITSILSSFEELVENPNINELEKSLYDHYKDIENAFKNLTAIPADITELAIKNNTKIIEVKEILFDEYGNYNSDYGFDINSKNSLYIKSEIDSIKNYWLPGGLDDEEDIDAYFKHVENIIASKAFAIQNKQELFEAFFNGLKICLDTYNCYWSGNVNKGNDFAMIYNKLYDIELLQFINVVGENEDGAYLKEKIIAASSPMINSETEIIKNNLIKIGEFISGASGVTEDRLSERLKPIEDDIIDIKDDITDIETDITNIEDNISTIKKRLDIEVPGRINAESDKILNNLEPKIISNSNLLAENITKVNHLSDNIQNYSGFINYDIVHDEIDIDSLGIITVKGSTTTYKRYEADESGILYIIKGESTAIKFIPYTILDTETNYEPNEFYKSLYCSEEGLNVPFISINLLKGSGVIFPSDVNQKLYFIPYLTVAEIDDIIKE